MNSVFLRAILAALLGLLLGTGFIALLLVLCAAFDGVGISELLGYGRQAGLKSGEVNLVLRHSISFLYATLCIALALTFMRLWFSSNLRPTEDSDSIDSLKRQFDGRLASSIGYILGEMSVDKKCLKATEVSRLDEAIRQCEKGYQILREVGGADAYMALNNLVFFSAIRKDRSRRYYVLNKARELRDVGTEHDSVNFLLTYCAAIIANGTDEQEEMREVYKILSDLAWSNRESVKEDAQSYLALIQEGNG